MIFPIVAYGHPVLRKVAQDVGPDYPGLKEFISDLFETMYKTDGVGLAAPQVNRSIRIFVIDASHFSEQQPELEGFRKAFINPHITAESGEEWIFNEGCLSVPDIREDISRKPRVRIEYVDEDFVPHDEIYEGIAARIIQHEYDHLQGIMLVDRISPLRKMLLKRKLNDITTGNIDVAYKMIFPGKKGKVKV
jgi:peptide deformylase